MPEPIAFLLNDSSVESSLPPATVVLDYLRRERGLTGTKEVCREGDCGACMVLLGEAGQADGEPTVLYKPVNSCLLPLGEAAGRHVVSIEGLNPPAASGASAPPLNAVQRHLVEQGAIQCGFCTPGFVVALTGFLLNTDEFTQPAAVRAVAGNICRCTGYASIRRAIQGLVEEYVRHCKGSPPPPGAQRIESLIGYGTLPPYFREIPERLRRRAAARRAARGAARSTARTGAGRRPVWIAGGTDLFVQRPEELLGATVAFVSTRAGIAGARVRKDRLVLGAGTSMEQLRRLPDMHRGWPQLVQALELVASAPIRERATIGGNIVNASPIGDLTIMFLALGARLGIRAARGASRLRELALEEFFLGYKRLALNEGEVLEWVSVPAGESAGTHQSPRRLFSFEKVSRRQHLDIASVNTAALFEVEDRRIRGARLSAGGVAPVPLLLRRASAALAGAEVNEQTVRRALDLAQEEIAPISDVRGSADYKRLLLRRLLLAHFLTVFPEALPQAFPELRLEESRA